MECEPPVESKLQANHEPEDSCLSRRTFLLIVPGGALVSFPDLLPAGSRQPYQRKFLTRTEALTVEAVAARIIPGGESPGAKEAQVVNFIDHLLSSAYAAQQSVYRSGVQKLNELARSRFKRTFVRLSEAEQDTLLAQMERGEIQGWKDAAGFFAMIRGHTVEGMFADPKYHGNTDGLGWKLLGAEEHK